MKLLNDETMEEVMQKKQIWYMNLARAEGKRKNADLEITRARSMLVELDAIERQLKWGLLVAHSALA